MKKQRRGGRLSREFRLRGSYVELFRISRKGKLRRWQVTRSDIRRMYGILAEVYLAAGAPS